MEACSSSRSRLATLSSAAINAVYTVVSSVMPSRTSGLHVQIGVRQVIAGWDEGILGDGKDLPPMKVIKTGQYV